MFSDTQRKKKHWHFQNTDLQHWTLTCRNRQKSKRCLLCCVLISGRWLFMNLQKVKKVYYQKYKKELWDKIVSSKGQGLWLNVMKSSQKSVDSLSFIHRILNWTRKGKGQASFINHCASNVWLQIHSQEVSESFAFLERTQCLTICYILGNTMIKKKL